jgi:hypothetical protein
VFAGKVITASGLQRSPRRGLDEGDSASGETRDYLWRMRRFGSHHRACAIRDHGLRGGPRIEDRECPAGHCLPPAALDHTRPRGKHGMQRLPHDGVLTSELQCQGAQRVPLQLSAALEALPVPTLGMCTRPLEALPQGAVCPPPRGPGWVPRPWQARPGPTPAARESTARSCPGGRPACLQSSSTPTAVQPRAYLGVLAPRAIFGQHPKIGCQECDDRQPPNARKSHLAPAPAQRAKRGSVTPLRGLMTVSFTPR